MVFWLAWDRSSILAFSAIIVAVSAFVASADAQTPWPTTTTWGNSSLSAPYIALGPGSGPGVLDLNGRRRPARSLPLNESLRPARH